MLTERRIEIWFERMVDKLDEQFMSGLMCSAEYEVEYRELKDEVERLDKQGKVGAECLISSKMFVTIKPSGKRCQNCT